LCRGAERCEEVAHSLCMVVSRHIQRHVARGMWQFVRSDVSEAVANVKPLCFTCYLVHVHDMFAVYVLIGNTVVVGLCTIRSIMLDDQWFVVVLV
jgi:hypothetical protein